MAEASNVSPQIPTDHDRNASGDSASTGLSELAQLARQAFVEKRRKQSMALTNAILKIDPQNQEALVLQSWVRTDLDKEMDTATRAFHQAKTEKRFDAYDRTERLLLSILGVDAEYRKASELLAEVRSQQSTVAKNRPTDVIDEEQILDPSRLKEHGRRWTGVLLALLVITT